MLDRLDDTIVAISSPPGVSVRGIVRLSGPQAIAWVDQRFAAAGGKPLRATSGWRRLSGEILVGQAGPVPAEVYLFRGPRSYTRQDIVEVHTLGSPVLLDMLLADFARLGARPAGPGEFTARAFFNGALDLLGVEGVAAIIHARSDAQLRAAETLLHGRLSREVNACRDRLADLLALIEAGIDFADEDIEFVGREQVRAVLAGTAGELDRLLAGAAPPGRLEVLPQVLLAGPPNAGKSTLLNRLTGMERAIASPMAHTTRDIVSAPLRLPAGEVILLDSPGLDLADPDAGDRNGGDDRERMPGGEGGAIPPGETAFLPPRCPVVRSAEVQRLAQRQSGRALARADLVIWLVEAGSDWRPVADRLAGSLAGRPVMLVASKSDLLPVEARPVWVQGCPAGRPPLWVSAVTGEGLEELREAISACLLAGTETCGGEVMIMSRRQIEGLSEAREALGRALDLCGRPEPPAPELLAVEIRAGIEALSLLTGALTTEEVLGRIFARFCIGK